MKVEHFNHATASDAGTSGIARRLLDDSWTPPSEKQQTKPIEKSDALNSPEQRFNDMIESAKEGRMDSTAKLMMLNALVEGNVPGMYAAGNKLNQVLTESGADYRVRIGIMEDESGAADISFALVKSDEKAETILQDLVDKGDNSQYRDRGMHISIPAPEQEEPQIMMPEPRRQFDI